MFDNFTKSKPKRRGLRVLAVASAGLHLSAGALLIVAGLWEIEEVGRPHRGLAMATSLPPASAPAGTPEAAPEKIKEKRERIVKEARQPDPTRVSENPLPAGETTSTGSGTDDGEGTGTGTGPGGQGLPGLEICIDVDGCSGDPLPELTEAAKEPLLMEPAVLDQLHRTAGDPQVQPPSSTKNAMSRAGQSRIMAIVRMCLDTSGQVNAQSIVKSSGHSEYDAKLLSAVRKWRYQPYRVRGTALAICTHVTFIYQQE